MFYEGILGSIIRDRNTLYPLKNPTPLGVGVSDEYRDGNETELGRTVWVLGSLGGKVVVDTVPYKQTLDEVDTETIYKAWEQAYEKGLVSVQECEEELLKRDPDTPECERILEKYQEINKEYQY